MANLKDKAYEGKGGAWISGKGSPKVHAQGSIQIGGRVIALTLWYNNRGGTAPHYNITVNEQKTLHDDVVWFRSLHPDNFTNGAAPTMTGSNKPIPDDDIPF